MLNLAAAEVGEAAVLASMVVKGLGKLAVTVEKLCDDVTHALLERVIEIAVGFKDELSLFVLGSFLCTTNIFLPKCACFLYLAQLVDDRLDDAVFGMFEMPGVAV